MATKLDSRTQERLVCLYLRLNGYFVTPFVVHSDVVGRIATEVDAVAVRFPFNEEPERVISTHDVFDVSRKLIEVVIGEVKSRGQPCSFNKALKGNRGAVESVLRWAGMFDDNVIALATNDVIASLAGRGESIIETPQFGQVRVRTVMFLPETRRRPDVDVHVILGEEMLDYIWRCMCPPVPRPSCAVSYDFQTWGDLESLVRFIKSKPDAPPTIEQLYEHCSVPMSVDESCAK